jgi:hypothetical protein
MKQYRLFLAYYTFIATVASFIWSLFFAPRPQSFLLTLFLLPASIYFWLLLTKPQSSNLPSENQGKSIKIPLIVLMTLFISSFSIYAYSEMNNRSFNSEFTSLSTSKQLDLLRLELENQNKTFREELTREFGGLKSQLINLKTSQKVIEDTETLGDTTSAVGTVTIIDKKYPTVNVYTEKSSSSAVIGKAEFGKTYTFIEKDSKWYLILLGAKEGFINNQFVKEIQY